MWCIDNPHTDPLFNLAAEEYLFHYQPDAVFMLWQNDPAVLIGKHQEVKKEVNLAFARSRGIKIVRRFSGGGAVYQDRGNFNLTFIETSSCPSVGRFTHLIQDFLLTSYSLPTQADTRQALFVNKLKISGCAQYIRKGRILHHATLLFSTDLHTLSTVLDAPSCPQMLAADSFPRPVESVKSPVANLSTFLPPTLSLDDFRKEVFRYFTSLYPSSRTSFFTPAQLQTMKRLRKEKYANRQWNIGTYLS